MIEGLAQLVQRDEIGIPERSADADLIPDIIIPTIASVVAVVSIIFIIIGGFRYVASAGSPEQIKQAKDTIIYALVGLVVAILSVTIVRFVVNSL